MNYFKEGEESSSSSLSKEKTSKLVLIKSYYNAIKDKLQIYIYQRWIIILILFILYLIRILKTQGFYALTYCIGIHVLNSFIGFLSPLEDPEENDNENDSFLPQKNEEEFRPFKRKVKEFKFWSILFWTFFIGFILTFFEAFDIPVFWPLLLFYFIMIFILTMRKQIQHMIKYHYLPWDAGKIRYDSNIQLKK